MAQTDFTISKPKFKHLVYSDRVLIAFMLSEGYSQTRIAQELGVNRSTASREIHRGSVLQIVAGKTVKRYFAETAQSIADASKANVGRKPKFLTCEEFIEHADALMKEEGFSPDAVVGQALDLELFRPEEMVCTNTLYRYIDSGILTTKNIDLTQKLSRKLRNVYARENKRVFGKSIDERPAEINDRSVFGHWEIDCVLLKKTKEKVLLTLIERISRQSIIRILEGKTATCVSQAMSSLRREYGNSFKSIFKSITADNGSEFAELSACMDETSTEVYYAHPYSSWERGANERNNGMIRRFIPKGFDASLVTEALVRKVENWLNRYPRKVLGYASSFDVFYEHTSDLVA